MNISARPLVALSFLIVGFWTGAAAQAAPDTTVRIAPMLIVPDAVWDGVADEPKAGWVVLVRRGHIEAVGPESSVAVPREADRIELPGTTLIPGLIEGHSHLFLHPYNEATWDDQVLREPLGQRMVRAVASAATTLRAGITTERDLGTEGAFDYDVQLKRAIDNGVVPGPRIIAVTRAIVATGSYGPRRTDYSFDPGQGAEEASGVEEIARVVRSQIGHGADWLKVYADYRWGPRGEGRPTFSQAELTTLVETANSSGRQVAAHATTAEGMRRAVMAGVETIEHGDDGTREVFKLMRKKGVALCPTLATSEAYAQYFEGGPRVRGSSSIRVGQARELQDRARRGGDDLLRRRRRRLSPRRQRARARGDGGERNDPARRAAGRHQRQRQNLSPGRPGPSGQGSARRPGRGGGRPDAGCFGPAKGSIRDEGW